MSPVRGAWLGVLLVIMTGAAVAQSTRFAWIRTGDSLQETLSRLNEMGIPTVFSSALVRPEMIVRRAPSTQDFEALLAELLAPWKLRAIESDRGEWLIVRDSQPATPIAAKTWLPERPPQPDIATVNVTASRYGITSAPQGNVHFDREDVERMPHVFDDAVRMLKVLPGVNGGDFSARLNVRGGRRDETQLVIDGAQIYGGFHFREVDGMVSAMDSHLVDSLEFITGGMTAERFDAMSAIVDIRTLQPAPDDAFRHAVGISFVSAFMRSGGVFAENRGSWLASGRRGYLDLLVERVQPDDERLIPRYQDAFAKVRYELGDSTALSAHVLLGTSELRFNDREEDVDSDGDVQSAHAWFTLEQAINERLQLRTLASFATTDDRRDVEGIADDIAADMQSKIESQFVDVRQDWAWTFDNRNLVRWGANASSHEADYRYDRISSIYDPYLTTSPIDTSHSAALSASGKKWGAYASYRSRLTNAITSEIGGRWDVYRYEGGLRFSRFSPRLNAVWHLGGAGEIRFAWGTTYQPQGVHELQIEDGVDSFFQPERATHTILGYARDLGPALSLRVDVYRKEYDDLHPRFENALDPVELVPEAATDRIRIDAARARSTGVELSLRRPIRESWGGWLSYAYARAEDLEHGSWRARSWDHRQTVSFGLSWAGVRWSANLAGIYQSGSPTTPVYLRAGNGTGEPPWVKTAETRNSDRFDAFARLDARISRKLEWPGSELSYYFEIINLLNRDNPCCVEEYEIGLNRSTGNPSLQPQIGYWMPLLPSFGFQYRF